MNKTLLYRYSRKVHKWAGLVLGIQLVLWIMGGLVMSAIPRDKVHGDHLVNGQAATSLPGAAYRYPVDDIIAKTQGQVRSVSFSALLDKAVYRVKTEQGEQWFDAQNGDVLTGLSQSQVTALVNQYYVGEGQLVSLQLLQKLPQEMRGRTNLWQATFDDWVNTTLYLSPTNGQLIRVRSDIWRLYDIFWMLHIMDYTERDDSHNWLLIISSAFGLLFALSGMVLLFQVFKKRDFKLKKRIGSQRIGSKALEE